MKKSTRYKLFLIGIAAVLGIMTGAISSQMQQKDIDTSDSLHLAAIKISPALLLDSVLEQIQHDRQTEFDYYLDRHNVEDEGYEMVAAFANGQRHHESLDTIPLANVGRWKNIKRKGTAISHDSLGRIIIGQWDNDTLVSGIRIDSTGIYQGAFFYEKAHGHGA